MVAFYRSDSRLAVQAGHSAAVLRDCPPACGLLLDVAPHSNAVARLHRESGVVGVPGECLGSLGSFGSLNPLASRFGWFGIFWRVLGHQFGPSQRGVCASSYAIHSKHAFHASRGKPSAVLPPRKSHRKNLAVKPAQRLAMRSEVKGEAEGRRTFAQHSKPLRWLDRKATQQEA